MEFVAQEDDVVFVWDEQNRPPFDDRVLGALRRNEEGYYEFHGGQKIIMNCKQCRQLAEKLSELNRVKDKNHDN